jgi:RHH-type rel operon transcriptional repressor/antitoxin RelB
MLAIRLDKKTEDHLTHLARQAGRTKTAYARAAILEHLEDLEDTKLALARLAQPARIYSSREVKDALGL